MTNPLATRTQTPQSLSEIQTAQLYALYATYYGGTSPELFQRDLQEKDQILILQDGNTPVGFTTLKIIRAEHQNQPVRAVFSGDTIIRHEYWGSQTLPLAWCELIGKIQAQQPRIPLYWLLIVKGDRTYRYLNVFSKQYYPNRKTPPPPEIQSLMNQLARERFGAHYLPERGIVHYPQSQGHLKARWHNSAAGRNPEAQCFAEKNPHYQQGDELVCLTLLDAGNLKSFALRGFLAGQAAQQQAACGA